MIMEKIKGISRNMTGIDYDEDHRRLHFRSYAGSNRGKGLFTKELDHGLRRGIIDIAVHSLKESAG
jgi:hypothetical protein